MTLPSNGAVTLGLAGTSTGSVGARSVAANTLLDLSIGQFLAQEEASLRQGVARVGDARAAGNFKAGLGSFTKQLESNLAPDASGKTRYDHKLDQIDDERIRILTELEANPADPSALLRRLAELDQFTQLIRKAREKQEELLALVQAIMMGVVPSKAQVARCIALGLGPIVAELLQAMIGDGTQLSKADVRELRELQGLGISIAVPNEEITSERKSERAREQTAVDQHGALIELSTRDVLAGLGVDQRA